MGPRQTAPTLATVAAHAGVSTATVSRCLNQPDVVDAQTRDRVMQSVRALGYAPNFGAQALAAKRTNTVGVVIPSLENAVFALGIQAFQEELGAHGKTLLIASSGYSSVAEDSHIRTLVGRGADALLLIGYDRDPALYDFLNTQNVPSLVAWSYRAKGVPPSVGFDNRVAMTALAERVIALGHRKIACISAPTADNDRARERVAGIRDALAGAGLPADAMPLIETPYSVHRGQEALHQILDTAPDTTAVMCGNDVLAAGALRAAKDRGCIVPDDLSITGFDDIELARLTEPALSTVHVPHREMGQRAAKALIQILTTGTTDPVPPLPTQICARGTLGPAR